MPVEKSDVFAHVKVPFEPMGLKVLGFLAHFNFLAVYCNTQKIQNIAKKVILAL
jgi:hypothetical protein